jgi:hypothetical protein
MTLEFYWQNTFINKTMSLLGKEVVDMQWKDLSNETKNVLERCWHIQHDRPLRFQCEIGKEFSSGNEKSTPTENTYKEILKYQKSFPHFDVKRDGDLITVNGNCEYGSWFEQITSK